MCLTHRSKSFFAAFREAKAPCRSNASQVFHAPSIPIRAPPPTVRNAWNNSRGKLSFAELSKISTAVNSVLI
ncbi:hypothetical protein EMEDMD4_340014 [Sinorhizobium medicae]|uniref:Uncharacterized protein n=1 Tax=Sinorhizobium medicae TaxID=110321 RepID=A0A508WXA6_9HYPH|nr:hypothetical protein EMEDMD4_340014 [Sinorhizobium medicae]